MAKYDEQLNRMLSLMEDSDKPKKVSSNLWYHANGADGKVYGIVKEGAKFYIKRTENGKENIVESYDYLNGFVNRREQEYKSYNEATKQLELTLMSLNEAYGKKTDVSTVDMNRNEKALSYLTEEARKELDRMHQIIENCDKIGPNNVCDPESKGKATPENTTKNNDPFTDKVTPDMDYKGSKGTVEESGDGSKVADVSSDLQSDKMKTKNSNLDADGNDKEYKDAHDDLEGESVADQNPKGGKVVRVNEGLDELGGDLGFNDDLDNIGGGVGVDDINDTGEDMDVDPMMQGGEPALEPEPLDGEEPVGPEDNGLVGTEGDEDMNNFMDGSEEPMDDEDLDAILQEFMEETGEDAIEEEEDLVAGDNKVMTHEDNPINGTNNGVDGETGEDWKRVGDPVNIKEDEGFETDKSENTETMDNYKFGYNKEKKLPVQSWDKMNLSESQKKVVNALVESIYNKLVPQQSKKESLSEAIGRIVKEEIARMNQPKKKETLEEAIERIVKEEVTNLNVWGKHPKYGKEPMTHPEAKEVMAGTADRDWNDDSAKGSERYGKKIGVGKPFDQETVDLLTDQVLAKIKGAYRK